MSAVTASSPSVLFVPVSGPSGMGEFARARSIADALVAHAPDIGIHFLLHRAAPYAASFHHPATLLPASPTLCTREAVEVIPIDLRNDERNNLDPRNRANRARII